MKQDLIFSRKADNSAMNLEEIQARAPAAFVSDKSPDRSSRYAHINTSQAIEILADYGYQVTQAAQIRSRTQEACKYAQHMLALSNPDHSDSFVGGGAGRPEIILYNSGDASSSLKMFAGFYRFICSNGIIAGNGFEVKARHYQTTASRFEAMIKEAAECLPVMVDNIERMQNIQLDHVQELGLARQAAGIRWKSLEDNKDPDLPFGCYATGATTWNLLKTRRAEDLEPNAWTAFNRIQEGLIRGGVEVLSVSRAKPAGKPRKAQAIASVKEAVRVNRDLWDLFDIKQLEEVAA